MKKFSEFTQATNLTNDDLLLISQWDGVSAYETKYITANLAESVSKKEFIARIEQVGVLAPNITVIKDDFGGTYVTAYNGVGEYVLQGFNSELTTGFEEVQVNVNSLAVNSILRTQITNVNEVTIFTYDLAGLPVDGVIPSAHIHVTKYL
jgi:hypothetical protein